jgi:hypothetical protein
MSKSVDKLRAARKTGEKKVNTDEVFKSNFERPDIENLILDENLRSFIPPLKNEELTLLEESIRNEGVRDALLVWKDQIKGGYILVDGYNRHSIIQKLQKEGINTRYNLKPLDFDNFEEVKDWMIINQLGRRNLTDEQRSYLRGLRYNREKDKHGGKRKSSDQIDHLKTSDRLAEEYKVGPATIRRDAEFASGLEKIGQANPLLKQSILSGRTHIKKSLLQKLGKLSVDAESIKVEDASSIASLIQEKFPKRKREKNTSDIFNESRDQIITLLKTKTIKSKAKEIQKIRVMLDKLEQMLK